MLCLPAPGLWGLYHSSPGNELGDSRASHATGLSSQRANPPRGQGTGGRQGQDSREQMGPMGTSCRAQKDASTLILFEIAPYSSGDQMAPGDSRTSGP